MKEASKSDSASSKRSTRAAAAAAEVPDISADVEQVTESVQRAAQDVGAYIRDSATHRPYMTLGVAAGVGFVLGGGLSPRMTTTLLGFGGRLIVNALLQNMTAESN